MSSSSSSSSPPPPPPPPLLNPAVGTNSNDNSHDGSKTNAGGRGGNGGRGTGGGHHSGEGRGGGRGRRTGGGGSGGRGRSGRDGRGGGRGGPRKRSHQDGNNNNSNNAALGRGAGVGQGQQQQQQQGQQQQGRLIRISKVLSWALRHGAAELKLCMTPDGYCPVQQIIQHPKYKSLKLTLDEIILVVETNDKQRFKLERRPASDYSVDYVNNVEQQQHKNDGVVGEAKSAAVVSSNTDNDDDDNNNVMILCIRANQGHSIKPAASSKGGGGGGGTGITIDPHLLLTPISPERLLLANDFPVIVHGTYWDRWQTILATGGLKRMNRHHIHFATGGVPGRDNDGGVVISGMRQSCQVYIYINGRKCARDGIVFFQSDNGVLLTAGKESDSDKEASSTSSSSSTGSGMLPIAYFSHVTDNKGNVLLDQRGHDDSSLCL